MLHLMPTPNPRISVTLPPSLAAILRELSALTGNSQSALISELLETSKPIFERMVTVLRAAASVKDEGLSEFVADLQAAESRMTEQFGLPVIEEFDAAMRPLLDHAEAVKRRRGRIARGTSATGAGDGAPLAPMSNRGVTPHPKSTKRAGKTVAKGGRNGPV